MALNSPKELICLLQCEQFIPFTPVDSGSLIIKFGGLFVGKIDEQSPLVDLPFFCLILFIFLGFHPPIVSHSFLKYWAQLCTRHCNALWDVGDDVSVPVFKGSTRWWGTQSSMWASSFLGIDHPWCLFSSFPEGVGIHWGWSATELFLSMLKCGDTSPVLFFHATVWNSSLWTGMFIRRLAWTLPPNSCQAGWITGAL